MADRLRGRLKTAAKRALGHPLLWRMAALAAAWRSQDLVLVYHRITPDSGGTAARDEVTPSVGRLRLRAQLEALTRMGQIVDLPTLLDLPDRRGPRFAITFDDDYPHHTEHALPVLREVGVPATFFLSGRVLYGLGPYWWERLEALVAAVGIDAGARALDVAATSVQALALVCESDANARLRLAEIELASTDQPLQVGDIRALVSSGMTIGFHTLEHPILSSLDDDQLALALRTGRAELAAVVDKPIVLLAYPHGKADERVARATRAAGYQAAWTGRPRPYRRSENPFLLGRWEPGPLETDAFMGAVAVRLHREAPITNRT